MGKIKLLKPLWNRQPGTIVKVNTELEKFAIRKGYAELVIEPIQPKAEIFDYKNKVEPDVKKLRNKSK